ncbi:hypothetical protein [Nocardioides rubriscoriae]|uniref:hypothetical protein n=1 Tax=Nocardioides rubriscoriae TaxID=642762 RepID=UPI0011E051D7|nr:hypothetical protein [Nocardioides rubriscoriae]
MLTTVSDDVVVVYAVCAEVEAGLTLTLILTLPRPEALKVPCDGVVSRTQVFTVRGRSFGVDVVGTDDVDWSLRVTTREE